MVPTTGPFDVFFSSHVIEHFPNPHEAFAFARRQLRPGGVFIAFTPNGSEIRLHRDRKAYNHSWGRLHPIYLDDAYYRRNLPAVPKLFMSRPYGGWKDLVEVECWEQDGEALGNMSHAELLAVWLNVGR